MSRPVVSPITNERGFTPTQTRSTPAVVTANVNRASAAPSGAELLADAVGLAAKVADPLLKQEAQRRQEQGTTDARLGKIDEKQYAEDWNYRQAAYTTEVQRQGLEFLKSYEQRYADNLDKGMSAEDVAKDFDQQAQATLGHFIGDKHAAAILAKPLSEYINKKTGDHMAQLSAERVQRAIATQGELMRLNIEAGQPVEMEQYMSVLRPLMGASKATAQVVEMVGAMAVEKASPELVDALLPADLKWADGTPGPRNVPALNEKLNQAKYYAAQAANAKLAEAAKAKKLEFEGAQLQVMQLAREGNFSGAERMLTDLVNSGKVTERSDLSALDSFIRSVRNDKIDRSYNPAAMMKFRLEYAENPDAFSNQDVINNLIRLVPQNKDGMQMASGLADDLIRVKEGSGKMSRQSRIYLDNLKSYKPEAWLMDDEANRVWADTLLEYEKNVLAGKDVEASFESAKKLMQGLKVKDKSPPITDISKAAEAFTNKQYSRQHLVQDWGNRVEEITNAANTGKIPPEVGKAMLRELGPR